VIMAGIDTESGKKYRVDQALTKWSYVETVFKDMAQVASKRFDKLSGRESAAQ